MWATSSTRPSRYWASEQATPGVCMRGPCRPKEVKRCEKHHVIGLTFTKAGPALELFRASPPLLVISLTCCWWHPLLFRSLAPFRTTYAHPDDAPLFVTVGSEEKLLSFLLYPSSIAPLSVLPSNCSTPSKASFFSPLIYRCGACTSSLVEQLGSSNIEVPATWVAIHSYFTPPQACS